MIGDKWQDLFDLPVPELASRLHEVELADFQSRCQQVISILEEWFQAIEAGVANSRMPDLTGKRYSKEQVDRLIKDIDDLFEQEIFLHPAYWSNTVGPATKGKPIAYPADFNRLNGAAREAFAQAVYKKVEQAFGNPRPIAR